MKVIRPLLKEDESQYNVVITNNYVSTSEQYYIDFIPRKHITENLVYDYITTDSTLISTDSTLITADLICYILPSESEVVVQVTNELTNETFIPEITIGRVRNDYRLVFLSNDFISDESKYSITIKDRSNLLYKGKMIYTLKDIQNYRYTNITNDKLYI